jgi:SAM-dependent methyltransferase
VDTDGSELDVPWQPCAPPRDGDEVRARHEANRAAWDECAGAYAARVDETIAFLRAGGSNLHPLERAMLGDLGTWCRLAIHLQCASGRDTLSLWNEGAREVVGLDISDVHVANARRTSEALGAPARWIRCDVLDAPESLDGSADLVYTGRGALCWIHDLVVWGRVVARLLRPGGVVTILDDHPASALFDHESDSLRLSGVAYFGHAEVNRGWPGSYVDLGKPAAEHAPKYERLWTLAEVHQALTGAGLAVEHLGEHPEGYWDAFARLPARDGARVPLSFTLRARKPGGRRPRARGSTGSGRSQPPF